MFPNSGNRLTTAVLAAAVFASLMFAAGSVYAQQPSTSGLPVVERTRYTTTYQLADGSRRAVLSIDAQNYQRADGSWAPVREELDASSPSSGMDWECTENGLVSRFGTVNGRPLVTTGAQNAPALSMTAHAWRSRNAAGQILAELPASATAPERVSARSVQYRNLFPSIADEYVVRPDGVKHSLVLDASALAQLPADAVWAGGTFDLTLPAGHTIRTWSGAAVTGSMTISDGFTIFVDGTARYRVYPVTVIDSSGSPDGAVAGRYAVEVLADGRIRLTMEAPVEWMSDPARVLPVRIDPTLVLQPDAAVGKDAPVYEGDPNRNDGTRTVGWLGRSGANYIKTLFEFDLGAIPGGSQVTSATFDWAYLSGVDNNGNAADCHLVTSAWVETTITWNIQPTYDAATFDTIVLPVAGAGFRTWSNFASTVQDWLDGAVTNNGFVIECPAGADWSAFKTSDDAVAADRPMLTIDYTTGVAISTPAAGALADGYVGEAWGPVTFTSVGEVGAVTWAVTAGALPAGLTLGTNSGVLDGTPTTATNATFDVTVTDTANNDTDTRSYTIDIFVLPTIITAAGPLSEGTQSAPTSYGLPAVTFSSSGGAAPFTWSQSGLPAGLSINPTTSEIFGTPPTATTINVDVTVTDANGKQDTKSYTIVVNAPVQVTTTTLTDGDEIGLYSETAASSDGTGPMSWSMVITPALPEVTINSSTGAISGTPPAGSAGAYSVDITVTDQYGSTDTSASISLTINTPSFGTGGTSGCSCTADGTDRPGARRGNDLQGLGLLVILLTLAVIRRRLG